MAKVRYQDMMDIKRLQEYKKVRNSVRKQIFKNHKNKSNYKLLVMANLVQNGTTFAIFQSWVACLKYAGTPGQKP